MFLLISRRIFALGLLTFLLAGCVQNDPANFPDLADFPKEPIMVPSPEAQKKQQAVLRAAYGQIEEGVDPDMPEILATTTVACWPSQSAEIMRRILPLMAAAPTVPVMIYLSGSKINHPNMLHWGTVLKDGFICQGIPPDRIVVIIDFCNTTQDIQIKIAFANLGDTASMTTDDFEIEETDHDRNGS